MLHLASLPGSEVHARLSQLFFLHQAQCRFILWSLPLPQLLKQPLSTLMHATVMVVSIMFSVAGTADSLAKLSAAVAQDEANVQV
jgi:hypothetical protein